MKRTYLKTGKVGNVVYSRNRHGPICYARVVPSNPRTPKQMAVRKLWGIIAALWRLLTDAQREQWRAAGRQQRCRRRMGPRAPLTGFHYFMRVNMRRACRGEEYVGTPRERPSVERESVRALVDAFHRPTYGVPPVLLRCTNGILDASLRCLGRAATVFAAAEDSRGTQMNPLQAAMN